MFITIKIYIYENIHFGNKLLIMRMPKMLLTT